MSPARHPRFAPRAWTLAIGFALGFVAACVPRDAGLRDVERLARERVGADVRLHPGEGDRGAIDADVRALLARPLTAASAIRVALLNNRALAASFEQELGVAQGELLGASLLPNPRLSGDVRFPVGSGASASPSVRYDVTATIDVAQILLLPARRGVAEEAFAAARVRVGARVVDVAYEAEVAFYRWQAASQRAALTRTVRDAARAAFDVGRALRDVGNLRALDVTQQQAAYEESRAELAEAETAALEAREQIDVALGLWGRDATPPAPGPLAEPPADELDTAALERRAVERSLELDGLRHAILAAARRRGLAVAEGVLPSLGLGATIVREEGPVTLGPAGDITLPLLNQNQGEVRVRDAELRRAEAEYVAVAVRVRSRARSARLRLELARTRALWFRATLLPLRARAVEQSVLQYNAMQLGVFELLAARRAQAEAARGAIAALRDYWIARAVMARVLAGRTLGAVDGAATEGSMTTMTGTTEGTMDPMTTTGEATGAP